MYLCGCCCCFPMAEYPFRQLFCAFSVLFFCYYCSNWKVAVSWEPPLNSCSSFACLHTVCDVCNDDRLESDTEVDTPGWLITAIGFFHCWGFSFSYGRLANEKIWVQSFAGKKGKYKIKILLPKRKNWWKANRLVIRTGINDYSSSADDKCCDKNGKIPTNLNGEKKD